MRAHTRDALMYTGIAFPDHLDMRWLGATPKPDGSLYGFECYQLLAEFRQVSNEATVTSPAGFVMDRASIPKIGRSFITKDGSWQRPSICHDFVFWKKGVPGVETFEKANAFFLAGMRQQGTPFIERNIIMAAVSSPIGWAIWEDDD